MATWTLEQKYVEVIDEGIYDAVVKQIEKEYSEKYKGDYLKWTFYLPDLGLEKTATSSANFSNKTKWYPWVRKIFGKPIPRDYRFNPDDLIGRPCRISIIHEVGKGEDEDVWDKVDNVLGPRNGAMPAGLEHGEEEVAVPEPTSRDLPF